MFELPRITAGRYTPRKSNLTDSTAFSFSPMIQVYSSWPVSAPATVMTPHTSASSLGGEAKGLGGRADFDLAHLLLGHLRAALADAERGEGDVDSLGVRRNLLRKPVQVDNHLVDLGIGEGVRLAPRHHHYLRAQRVLGQKVHDAPAHVPRRAQHNRRVLRLRLCRCHHHLEHTRNPDAQNPRPKDQRYVQGRERVRFCRGGGPGYLFESFLLHTLLVDISLRSVRC